HVAAALTGRGHRVRALVRRPEPARLLLGPAPELVPGDLADATTLAALVRGSDAVIHLFGIIVEAGPATFDAVHVEGTRRVLAAARAAGVRRFVHMSAVGARDEPGATRYHRTKRRAEDLVRDSGLSRAIFRPSLISGPENVPIRVIARLHRWSPVVPVFGGARHTRDRRQMLVEGSSTPASAIESVFGIRPLPFEAGLKSFLSPGRV